MHNNTVNRNVNFKTSGIAASDGAGVKLTRIIGTPGFEDLDPFLMLDRFESDNPDDYIGGFPPHPHRGFETVTYLLAGKMRHEDNQGHKGVIETGGVQWMTAGRGIIHSEMPEQTDGLLKGFQLWVNLPAEQKMVAPAYQEFSADFIPLEERTGTVIKVIAGSTSQGTLGPVRNEYIRPLMLDVTLDKDAEFIEPILSDDSTFVIVISGAIENQGQDFTTVIQTNELAVLSAGDQLSFKSLADKSQFLLVSASPINEPVFKGGPFVMNSREQIEQAFSDYRHGRF